MSWIGNIFRSVFNNEGLKGGRDRGADSQKPDEEHISEKKVNLKSMTKKQLETYGRSVGVELDRRHNKAKLIATLEDAIAS
jgi:hypothetical protein